MQIKLSYQPLRLIGGNISENDFDLYISQPRWGSVAKKMAIEPLEDAMKNKDIEEFNFKDFKVNKKMQFKSTTSWQKAFDSLTEFLNIRADDSRAYNMDGLKDFQGIGYCILTTDLNNAITNFVTQNTSNSKFAKLYWPNKKKNGDYPTTLDLPDVNYKLITPENAKIVLQAKRFCSGLEKQVTDAFKGANQEWFEDKTNYSKDQLPDYADSPVRKVRMIAGNKPIFIQLVREEVPQYHEIIDMVQTEMSDLENETYLENYRATKDKGKIYVNIKTVQNRLSHSRLKQDDLIKSKARYEIVP